MKSFFIVFVACVALCAAQAPGYSFPTRYQALVSGWVNDYLIDYQTAYVTGYLFADYSTGSIRVDEVWNITSIMGTSFGDLGLSYDTHIQYAGACYFYYYNASGVWCSPSPDSLFPQKIFPASSFVNVTEYEGQQCYYYEVHDDYGVTSGYINTVTNTPVAIYQNWNVPGIGVIKTLQSFLTFDDLSMDDDNFPENLFAIPTFCTSPSQDLPKARFPSIGLTVPRAH